jgi:D-alanyl-D-alanine carboxypeptidase
MTNKIYTLLIISFISVNIGYSQISTELQNQFQEIINKALIDPGVKGVSACVIMPDNSIWHGQAGTNGSGVVITDTTVFYGGSTTKTFVATRILQLWEEEKINLDTTYTAYIEPIKNVNNEVTVRQLLSHTSGIYNYTQNPLFFSEIAKSPTQFYSPTDILASFLDKPHVFQPGTNYEYSNSNYVILGLIIEAITGNPVSQELREHVYSKVPLKQTYLGAYEEFSQPHCGLWASENGKIVNLSNGSHVALLSTAYVAGAIVTYPPDEALFIRNLINGEILSDRALAEMEKMNPFDNSYGLGLMGINLGDNAMLYGHNGGIGNKTEMFHFPAINLTVVVMQNSENADVNVFNNLFVTASSSIINNKTDIKSSISFSISLYPNPALNELFVNLPDIQENASLEIYTITGICMGKYNVNNQIYSIDIRNFPQGMYILNYKCENSVKPYKFLKK